MENSNDDIIETCACAYMCLGYCDDPLVWPFRCVIHLANVIQNIHNKFKCSGI